MALEDLFIFAGFFYIFGREVSWATGRMVVVFHHPPWIYENLVESGVDHMDEARTFLYSVEKELKDFLN